MIYKTHVGRHEHESEINDNKHADLIQYKKLPKIANVCNWEMLVFNNELLHR